MGYAFRSATQTGTQLSVASNLWLIKEAVEEAGWVIDTYTAASRLHAHYDGEHIEVVGYDTTRAQACYCTGYSSGSAWNAQPGTSSPMLFNFNLWLLGDHIGVQVQDAQIFTWGQGNNTNMRNGLFFGIINQKIGSWSGGRCIMGQHNNTSAIPFGSAMSNSALYIDGAWVNNVLYGTGANSPLISRVAPHTGATLLVPPLMFRNNTVDANLKHPLGYIDNIYMADPAYYYSRWETILIGTDTYRWMDGSGWWYLVKAA